MNVTVYTCPACSHPMKWTGDSWFCRFCKIYWEIKRKVEA